MTIVKCRCCGKEFVKSKYFKVYCSNECKLKASRNVIYNPVLYPCTCLNCGKGFQALQDSSKYCSIECVNEAKKKTKRKPALSIVEITKLAREEGLQYGDYVAKYGL